jgi:hypothetical protein
MPQEPARPVSLTVRPLHVSHLCFEVGGILGRSFAELGTKVSAFDFDHLYKSFRDANKAHAIDPGRLPFDSDGIDAQTITTNLVGRRPFALAALRAEPVKAALNKAIHARENAFITKYGGVAAIADVMRKIIPFRGKQINRLSELSNGQRRLLNAAYEKDPDRSGVVTTTINTSDATSKNDGTSKTKSPDANERSTQEATSQTTEHHTVVSKNIEFRVPLFENLARDERAQISLGHEVVAFVSETHYLDRLEEVFKNELASIDADVNQLQVAYLNTILLSPIDGIVTGVYKNPGDSVSAGEPVFRVENNADVLIVASVVCRGPIVVGSMLQVETTLFDSPTSPVKIEAEVVAARRQGEDDQWEVIAKRSNLDATGKIIFPLGYHFDYDNTKVAMFGPGEI